MEQWIKALGGIAALATLAYAIISMLRSLREPKGREEPGARLVLRAPVLLVATVLFVVGGAALWRPLPIQVPPWVHVLLLPCGALMLFVGLALYLWGMRSLGQMFGPSTGFGVRLHAAHRLVTTGPYAHVRHPMYLAVITTALGSLLLYCTWTTLVFAIIMFGLAVRARREERVLAQEFGPEWEAYISQVPPWIPRLRIRKPDA
jgi:protein-S-isoprenylcysteine O-methyltransferase Ste14